MKAIDKLACGIRQKQNPTVMGLDTQIAHLPEEFAKGMDESPASQAKAIFRYNKALIDGLCDLIPAVKVQVAFYEQLGLAGMEAFSKTVAYAREKGYVTMGDCKRNDIGSTAAGYAKAYLSGSGDFSVDFLTVNGYLGVDGIEPFTAACRENGGGIFVLVKTSNPSSAQLQDRIIDGKPLYEIMGSLVADWGKDLRGKCGYSSVGAVVGATHPREGVALRAALPQTFFLVPGYGAQGGTAKDLAGCFDAQGGGAVVNASRSLLCAHQKAPGMHWLEAVRAEAIRMRDYIMDAVSNGG